MNEATKEKTEWERAKDALEIIINAGFSVEMLEALAEKSKKEDLTKNMYFNMFKQYLKK